MPRRYLLEHLRNARDLGGYASIRGGQTRFNRYIRCASTDQLTPEEVEQVLAWGVTDVIDLRSDEEILQRPSAFARCPHAHYMQISLSTGEGVMGVSTQEACIADVYLHMAENAAAIRELMRVLSDAKGAAMFHCTAGKDRTGITAAILLMLAGVPGDDIVADYMVSGWYVREAARAFRAAIPDLPAHLWQSKPEYMERFLALLLAKYGTVERYLAAMGVPESHMRRIAERLLEPPR